MPTCGSQIILCDLPIRFDTYQGCSHLCRYCFAQNKVNLSEIRTEESPQQLLNFIRGQRNITTEWCDWNIPIHWGGLSDPFQPAEKKIGASLQALKIFAETQYPFVVSTKGKLICESPYIDLIAKCNCVVQISAVCSKYDVLEKGAPPFEERLEMARKLSKVAKRVIIRIQPYLTQCYKEVKENLHRLAEAGVYGVILEGMKFKHIKKGLVRLAGDFVYPLDELSKHFEGLKAEAHRVGLKFYCGENRLRLMGDAMCCCGIDGLEGFKPNTYNALHIMTGQPYEKTEAMTTKGGKCFSGIHQDSAFSKFVKDKTFDQVMQHEILTRKEKLQKIFGIKE